MCGRTVRFFNATDIRSLLDVSMDEYQIGISYNVAPTQLAPIVRLNGHGDREIVPCSWGLVPSWADDIKIGNSLINARAETVASKPSFRASFKSRRCVVPVSGFYEWQKLNARKQPWYIHRADGEILLLAGLWERWDKGSAPIESFTIITTDANDFMKQMHDRMPAVLEPEQVDSWLKSDGGLHADELQAMLKPAADGVLHAYPVHSRVNTPAYNAADCIESLPAASS